MLDAEPTLLAAFWRCVDATGMTSLRSPGVHHLDLHPYSLLRFGVRMKRGPAFVPPYSRPTVALFRAHCAQVIERSALHALHVAARATSITRAAHGYSIETTVGRVDASRVVLALGHGGELALPSWSSNALDLSGWHVFDRGFRRAEIRAGSTTAIIGGGISAVQLAMSLRRAGVHPIIVARHAPRSHRFDSDPGWLGPKAMNGFASSGPDRRRALIQGRGI